MMLDGSEHPESSSANDDGVVQVSMPSAAEVLMDAAARQQQALRMGQSNTTAQVPSVSELMQNRLGSLASGSPLLEDVKKNPQQVGWIGKPVYKPLAVIRGPSGTYVVSKPVVIIGRDTAHANTDLIVQENNYISRCHVILYHTGQANRWYVKVNGKNGVLINETMYRRSDQPQSIPYSCTFRFPSTHVIVLFCGMESLSRIGDSTECNVSLESTDSATSLPDSDEAFGSFEKPCTEGNTSVAASSELCQLVQTASICSAGANVDAASPAAMSVADFDQNGEDYSSPDVKPPYSYAQLIVQAILSSPDHQITLSGIYNYITSRYPWYRSTDKGWQNSIRHNLSLNRYFVKVARTQEEPGKGSFWRMESSSASRSIELAYRKRKPKLSRGSKVASPVVDIESEAADHISVSGGSQCSSPLHTQVVKVDEGPHLNADVKTAHSETITVAQKREDINTQVNSCGSKREIVALSAQDKVLQEDILRFAHSAPCSPKNVPPRTEFRSCGATFRVRQSPKDGRSRLQLCHSPPEYRSVSLSKISKLNQAVSSETLQRISSYQRSGTKSLSTTPVRDMLQGTSGLKLEDLKRDLIMLRNSNEQQPLNKGKETQQFIKRQSPVNSCRFEVPGGKAFVGSASRAAHQLTALELQHQQYMYKTVETQHLIGIKNYDGEAAVVVESNSNPCVATASVRPVVRKYGVDESVKLNISEMSGVAGSDKLHEDIQVQRKRTRITPSSTAAVFYEDYLETAKKSKIDGGIETYKAEEVLKMKQQNVSEIASDIVLMNGNVSGKGSNCRSTVTPPALEKALGTASTCTNSDFLTQQFQIAADMSQKQTHCSATASATASQELGPGEIALTVSAEKVLQGHLYTSVAQQQHQDFASTLKSQPPLASNLISQSPLIPNLNSQPPLTPNVNSQPTLASNVNSQLPLIPNMNPQSALPSNLNSQPPFASSLNPQMPLPSNLNPHPLPVASSVVPQQSLLINNWQSGGLSEAEFLALCHRSTQNHDLNANLNIILPALLTNASAAAAAALHPNYLNLFGTVPSSSMMTVAAAAAAAAAPAVPLSNSSSFRMQPKQQQLASVDLSSEALANYTNYARLLAMAAPSQQVTLSSSVNSEQQQQEQNGVAEQPLPHLPVLNFPLPTNLGSIPFLGRDSASNQWLDYTRLLAAAQSTSPGSAVPALWNPLSVLALQNACSSLPTLPDLQRQVYEMVVQRNCNTVCGNDIAQYVNGQQTAEVLAAIPSTSKMPSAQ